MIDASFSVIICSLSTITQLVWHMKRQADSINIGFNCVKTTQHDQSLTTPDSRNCDVESQDTASTATSGQSELSWNIVREKRESSLTGIEFLLGITK
jgi:hypothetical protein